VDFHHGESAFHDAYGGKSGNILPVSLEDRECKARILKTGKIFGIRIQEHIIIGETDYFSFADAGFIDQSPEEI
jgi:hypothetical protein